MLCVVDVVACWCCLLLGGASVCWLLVCLFCSLWTADVCWCCSLKCW